MGCLFISISSGLFGDCKLITSAGISEEIWKKQKIIAFSSWCQACKSHLVKAPDDAILLGVLDEPTRLQGAYKSLKLKTKCYIDADGSVARKLNINSVPFEIN